ncbi:MAG: hypothetical protein DDT27_01299 [Dehalococcoidia bacterium]|nr:hypothetical protein [Chloroflexota bacterium]
MSGGLIEENKFRLLSQCSGDGQTLSLATGEFTDPSFGKGLSPGFLHRSPGDIEIISAFVAKPAQMGCPSHEHDLKAGEGFGQSGYLRHHGDEAGQLAPADTGCLSSVDKDTPALWGEQMTDAFNQG